MSMRGPGQFGNFSLRTLGPVSKWLLIGLSLASLANAILVNWMDQREPMLLLRGSLAQIREAQLWRLVTASLLSPPNGVLTHTLYPLFILFWFMPKQEREWGAKRTILFALFAALFSNTLNVLLDYLPLQNPVFHNNVFMGFGAISMAFAVAWAVSNPFDELRLFFFPVSGNTLRWLLLAVAVLMIVYNDPSEGGFFAPLAGWAFGMAFGGSPSFFRRLFLKNKLARLERETSKVKKRKDGPPLRVVYGGLADELGMDDPNKRPDKDSLN
jgi:membrane associated rhomboid family serine protease